MQVYERSLACMRDRYGNRKCPLTPANSERLDVARGL
nr:MAG TPA: hypothetical protein [Caudoviricetes sp.]